MGWLVPTLVGIWAFAATPMATVPSAPPRARVGVALESDWYVQRWAFLGPGVRAEFRSRSGSAALVLEGAWLRERDGDDEVLRLGGTAVARLPLEGGGSFHLGIGVGWLRWRDPYGWDRGVWDRVYRKLTVGAEVPLAPLLSGLLPRAAELHGFVEFGLLPPWFHPAVSVGFSVPLLGSP